jgi:hypothetical protein
MSPVSKPRRQRPPRRLAKRPLRNAQPRPRDGAQRAEGKAHHFASVICPSRGYRGLARAPVPDRHTRLLHRRLMAMPQPRNRIPINAVPFSSYAQEHALQWPPPMRDLMKNPTAGDYVWKRLHYIFHLPDPRLFPSSVTGIADDERAVLGRFVQHARDLAGTTLLTATDSYMVRVSDTDGSVSVETELSDSDLTAGFMVMLRQCYADDEEASFSKVRTILERRLHETSDSDALDVLRRWRRAQASLRNKTSEELIQEAMIADGQLPKELVGPDGETRSPVVRPPESPHQMLQTFWYGSQVHWGKSRDALNEIQGDPYQSARWEVEARQAAVDLGHFYVGFAVIVERALGNMELALQ